MTYSTRRPTTPSPIRLNRFSERYKALTESPARDMTESFSIVQKNSPIRPAYTVEHEVIQNEDRGSWRKESMASNEQVEISDEVQMTQIKKSPRRPLKSELKRSQPMAHSPETKKQQQQQERDVRQNDKEAPQEGSAALPPSHAQTEQQRVENKAEAERSHENNTNQHHPQRQQRQRESTPTVVTLKKRIVPRYMRSTVSFHEKHLKSKGAVAQAHDSLLKSRTNGGITKRVSTSKVPRYKPTTKINASKEIKNEMAPGDTFVSMAAKIKMFERGLGNSSNRSAPLVPNRQSTSANSRPPSARSTTLSPQSSESKESKASSTSSIPRYLRQTSSSLSKMQQTKPKEVKHPSSAPSVDKDPKAFRQKLNLWKSRVKQASLEKKHEEKRTVADKGFKRKRQEGSTSSVQPSSKHQKNN